VYRHCLGEEEDIDGSMPKVTNQFSQTFWKMKLKIFNNPLICVLDRCYDK